MLIASPLQQWSCKYVSELRCMYIACRVI